MTDLINPYESFYHGLVSSKLWLCQELEKIVAGNPNIKILGCWHNLMAFMLIVRQPTLYNRIDGYDIDNDAIVVANQICNTWKDKEQTVVENHCVDVSTLDFTNDTNTIYINCSIDQFKGIDWFDTIPAGSIVCLQTTTLPITFTDWNIEQETHSLSNLLEKYKLTTVLYSGSKDIPYKDSTYTRLMAIGYK